MRDSGAKLGLLGRFRVASRAFRASGTWRPQSIEDLDRWTDSVWSGGPSQSGVIVTAETALNFSAFFSGVMQISQALASVDFRLFRMTGPQSKRDYAEHPVYRMLYRQANPWVDAFHLREAMTHNAIIWGNGYALIQREAAAGQRPIAWYLLDPRRMRVDLADSGELVYLYRTKAGKETRLTRWKVFHLAGFGGDGYTGYSLIQYQRDALGLGLGQQAFTGRYLAQGPHVSGILTHPGQLSPVAHENLKKSFAEQYTGLANVGRFPVLEEGTTFTPLPMPLKDAEFLGSKVFQIQEIARILNMPPHKLKELSHATYSNIEHQQIEWLTDTLRPWAERWEAAVDTQLLSGLDQKRAYSEHALEQLQRGDTKTMYEAYQIGRLGGFLNGDEIRYEIGRNPIDDPEGPRVGRMYWKPSNMEDAAHPASARPPAPNTAEEPEDREDEDGTDETVVPDRE